MAAQKANAEPFCRELLHRIRRFAKNDRMSINNIVNDLRKVPDLDAPPIPQLQIFGKAGGNMAAALPKNAPNIVCWLLVIEARL